MSGEYPLFDTPMSRVLDAASPDVAVVLQRLFAEPLQDVSVLRSEVLAYRQRLLGLKGAHEFLDLERALAVAARCAALLDGLASNDSEDVRRLVQAAARYLVMDDDAESDIDSPIGFDDDAEVVELVAREIGRDDVLGLRGSEEA